MDQGGDEEGACRSKSIKEGRMQHFEVAIIGGGIYGSAIAYFLSRQQVKTVLIEQGIAGAEGATGHSGGILRVYDPDPVLAYLSLYGVSEFRRWGQLSYPGISPYRGVGCLYRIEPANQAAASALVNEMRLRGYDGILLDHRDLKERFPWLHTGIGDLAIWEPGSGYADPRLASRNLAEGSVLLGATCLERCKVSGLDYMQGKWTITLPLGLFTAGKIVLTGGAYTPELIPGLPVFTRSISLLHLTSAPDKTNIAHPVIDEINQTYFRPSENCGYYCGTQIFEDVRLPQDLRGFTEAGLNDAMQRMGRLVKREYLGYPVNGFMGFDAYTTNKRPLIGQPAGYENLLVVTGFSGRGFKYALTVSRSVSYLLAGNTGKTADWSEEDQEIKELLKKCNF